MKQLLPIKKRKSKVERSIRPTTIPSNQIMHCGYSILREVVVGGWTEEEEGEEEDTRRQKSKSVFFELVLNDIPGAASTYP